jgi:hypothetical protein
LVTQSNLRVSEYSLIPFYKQSKMDKSTIIYRVLLMMEINLSTQWSFRVRKIARCNLEILMAISSSTSELNMLIQQFQFLHITMKQMVLSRASP